MKGIEKPSRVMGPRRLSMVQLLIALALLFFSVPFVEEIKGGALIVSGLLSLVLLSAVLAVADHHRTLIIALLLAISAIAGRWLNHLHPHLIHQSLSFDSTTRARARAVVSKCDPASDAGWMDG